LRLALTDGQGNAYVLNGQMLIIDDGTPEPTPSAGQAGLRGPVGYSARRGIHRRPPKPL
jgi:hypothetical protein